jgi:signal transduction histidine kinase
MFFRLFNWLLKKAPYTVAFALVCFSWTALVATFSILLILMGADFEATGTWDEFIILYVTGIGTASFLILVEFSLFRTFGSGWERPEFKALNDNLINGHFRQDIPTEELLKAYDALRNIARWKEKRNILYGEIIVVSVTLSEYLFSGQLTNIPLIFIGTSIATCSLYIYGAVFYDTITSQARRECKMLLAERGMYFKEPYLISLRTKSRIFIVLIAFALLSILILVKPLDPLLIVLSIITLIVIGLLNDMVFKSIYMEFTEIEGSAKDLAEGNKALFFSGSSDKEILDLFQHLNKTAGEITDYQKALREEKSALQDKVEELEEYMSISSHDLQQPLATIQAYAQVLKDSKLDKRDLKTVGIIESQAIFMRDLLEDLLDYSRTKRRMHFKKIKLDDVLDRVRRLLCTQIEERDADITFGNMPKTIRGQEKRIDQLLTNLIGNAIKYTDKKPVIEVGHKEREKNHLFWVRDNGRGIEKKYHKRIFKPFWKLGKEPGTGMGLAICKTIVENHGGRIWVESELGKGSTFYFTIPKRQ